MEGPILQMTVWRFSVPAAELLTHVLSMPREISSVCVLSLTSSLVCIQAVTPQQTVAVNVHIPTKVFVQHQRVALRPDGSVETCHVERHFEKMGETAVQAYITSTEMLCEELDSRVVKTDRLTMYVVAWNDEMRLVWVRIDNNNSTNGHLSAETDPAGFAERAWKEWEESKSRQSLQKQLNELWTWKGRSNRHDTNSNHDNSNHNSKKRRHSGGGEEEGEEEGEEAEEDDKQRKKRGTGKSSGVKRKRKIRTRPVEFAIVCPREPFVYMHIPAPKLADCDFAIRLPTIELHTICRELSLAGDDVHAYVTTDGLYLQTFGETGLILVTMLDHRQKKHGSEVKMKNPPYEWLSVPSWTCARTMMSRLNKRFLELFKRSDTSTSSSGSSHVKEQPNHSSGSSNPFDIVKSSADPQIVYNTYLVRSIKLCSREFSSKRLNMFTHATLYFKKGQPLVMELKEPSLPISVFVSITTCC